MGKHEIGDNLRALREQHGYTQSELGVKLGVDRKHISKLENGIIGPGEPLMVKICEVFGVDEQTVRFGERKEEKPQGDETLELVLNKVRAAYGGAASEPERLTVASEVLKTLAAMGRGSQGS